VSDYLFGKLGHLRAEPCYNGGHGIGDSGSRHHDKTFAVFEGAAVAMRIVSLATPPPATSFSSFSAEPPGGTARVGDTLPPGGAGREGGGLYNAGPGRD